MVVSTVPLGLIAAQVEAERQLGVALSYSELISSAVTHGEPGELDVSLLVGLQPTSLELDELYLLDASGAVLAAVEGSPPKGLDPALVAALERREQTAARIGPRWLPTAVVVTSPVGGEGTPPAALRVRLPVQGRLLSGLSLGAALFVPTLGLLPVLFFSGWVWLRRNLVRPIQALRDGTRRIARGQFGYQLQIGAPAELEELRDDLNGLSRSLRGYRRRTRRQVARLKRANAEIARAQDALVRSEKLAGVGRIAAGLAHEIGNPLTAVIGFQDLLVESMDDPGPRELAFERDLVARSRRELDRIHRILRQLLDYARPGSGMSEDVDVGAALRDAVATVRAVPAIRALDVRVEAPDALPSVRLEREKLHQVLVNLLLNAADATVETRTVGGSLRGEVRLIAGVIGEGEARQVEIRCEDSGPGFGPEAMKHAFEPFFTTKAMGKGTGLGLAMCQQVIEGAGGQISAENLEGGGACLRLRLPCAERVR